jgi:hypothetical protein
MVTTFSEIEKIVLRRSTYMQFTFTHPMHSHPYNPELVTGSGIATVAAAAEAAGFHGFGFTDHPGAHSTLAGIGWARRSGSVRGDGIRRGPDVDAAADPEHRGAAVPKPVRGGQVRRDAGSAVGRAVHARGRATAWRTFWIPSSGSAPR